MSEGPSLRPRPFVSFGGSVGHELRIDEDDLSLKSAHPHQDEDAPSGKGKRCFHPFPTLDFVQKGHEISSKYKNMIFLSSPIG
jgi:hypothetical protein